jgi:hypothetical protein
VQIVASHPNFDPRTFEFDLALMRFYEPVLPFQPNVLPICVPDDDEDYVGQTAFVTGWGRLYEGEWPTRLPLQVHWPSSIIPENKLHICFAQTGHCRRYCRRFPCR